MNVDFSLISMQSCRLQDKKTLYFEMYTTFQLYELPRIDQEVFLCQNQVSDLFCGDGLTKLIFFGLFYPTTNVIRYH